MNVTLYTDAGRFSSLSAGVRATGGQKAAAASNARTQGDPAQRADQVEISPEARQAARDADGSAEQQAAVEQAPEAGTVAGEEPARESQQKADAVSSERQAQPMDEEETETDEADAAKSSEQMRGSVTFNAAKRARQLAAARSAGQVQSVLSLLSVDLSDCKNGVKNGMCDENEVAKVEAMLAQAKQRLSEVSRTAGGEKEEGADAFAIASLM